MLERRLILSPCSPLGVAVPVMIVYWFIYIYIYVYICIYIYINIHSFIGYTTIVVGYIQAYWYCYHSYSWHLSINHNWFTIGSTASYCWCLSHQELAQGFWTNHHWEGIISFKCLIARPVYQYKNMKTKWLAISTLFQCFSILYVHIRYVWLCI